MIDASLIVGDITDQELAVSTCEDHGVSNGAHFAAGKSIVASMETPAKY